MATHSSTLFYFIFIKHAACGISVPQPGVEPMSPPLGARSPNHWTTGEVPTPVFLPGKSHGWRSLVATVQGVAKCRTQLTGFTSTFLFYAAGRGRAVYSSQGYGHGIRGRKVPAGHMGFPMGPREEGGACAARGAGGVCEPSGLCLGMVGTGTSLRRRSRP